MGNMDELTKNMENIEQKFLVYHEFFIIYYNDGEWGICRMGIHTNSRIFRDLQRQIQETFIDYYDNRKTP